MLQLKSIKQVDVIYSRVVYGGQIPNMLNIIQTNSKNSELKLKPYVPPRVEAIELKNAEVLLSARCQVLQPIDPCGGKHGHVKS